jgi:hypothetical protein
MGERDDYPFNKPKWYSGIAKQLELLDMDIGRTGGLIFYCTLASCDGQG